MTKHVRFPGRSDLLVVAASMALGVLATAAAAQDTLTYAFNQGDVARYTLSFEHHVKMGGSPPVLDVVTHSFVYGQAVKRIRSSGDVSLEIEITRTKFQGGRRATEFDSENPDHRRAAESEPTLRLFAAAATSKVSMGLKPSGEVTHFRLSSLGSDYSDERTKTYVLRSIEEVKDHAFLVVSGEPVREGGSWRTSVPIRFVGGPLAGRTLFADATLGLDAIEGSGADLVARYVVRSFEPPRLEFAEGSVRGASFDLAVRRIEGTVDFAPGRGRLEGYRFRIQAVFRIIVDGRTAQEQELDEVVSLKRLSR